MDQFDTDQNGVLDKMEWMAMLAALDDAGTENAEEWAAMFDVIDVGEDGKIRTTAAFLACCRVLHCFLASLLTASIALCVGVFCLSRVHNAP